jgi:glutamate carboxypeptidase
MIASLPDNAQIENALQERLPATLRLLEELVRINSFTNNVAGVNENARRIESWFAPLGFKASRVQCDLPSTGQHLILDSGGDGRTIACISHLDTVFTAEEEAANNFTWQVEGDRIYGPGTNDIKGGTALMWMLLDALARLEPTFFRSIRWMLFFNAAEEVLSRDFGQLCVRSLPSQTRACLVFEGDGKAPGPEGPGLAARFSVAQARKGSGKLQINVAGRAAHSGGRWEEGANAIHQLARVIDRASAFTDLTKQTTVNVGVVRGGVVTNRVPHEAQATLELRAFETEHYQRARDGILALAGRGDIAAISDGFACQVEMKLLKETPPWPRNAGTERLVEIWQQAGAACGHPIEPTSRGGLSDANWLWNHFPTIDGLGPRGGNWHASERAADGTKVPEFVDVTSFVPKALIDYLAVRRIISA